MFILSENDHKIRPRTQRKIVFTLGWIVSLYCLACSVALASEDYTPKKGANSSSHSVMRSQTTGFTTPSPLSSFSEPTPSSHFVDPEPFSRTLRREVPGEYRDGKGRQIAPVIPAPKVIYGPRTAWKPLGKFHPKRGRQKAEKAHPAKRPSRAQHGKNQGKMRKVPSGSGGR